MSILERIESALSGVGIAIGFGKYLETDEPCGKIIFFTQQDKSDKQKDKPRGFLGGGSESETFKAIVRGNDYYAIEQKANLIKAALKDAGFIQIGGYEDIESKDDAFMQLAVSFKFIKN